MKTPSKPCSIAYTIQLGLTALVHGRLITMTRGE